MPTKVFNDAPPIIRGHLGYDLAWSIGTSALILLSSFAVAALAANIWFKEGTSKALFIGTCVVFIILSALVVLWSICFVRFSAHFIERKNYQRFSADLRNFFTRKGIEIDYSIVEREGVARRLLKGDKIPAVIELSRTMPYSYRKRTRRKTAMVTMSTDEHGYNTVTVLY